MIQFVLSNSFPGGPSSLASKKSLSRDYEANYRRSECPDRDGILKGAARRDRWDRLQAEDCDAGCDWQDLVGSLLRGHPTVAGDVEAVGIREQTKARELAIAREIGRLEPKNRVGAWKEKTGKSQSALYRRLAELGRIDAPGR